ncbi:NUDIX domain-containing protein [Planomonospora sp. ID67723]|uniref:NUDIX hydrolase n=1 Tax=Planomonospora sp. ID67723 TaxID=2738134 RepID=UPI0027DC22C2|nr:NUDIX domain-containing protein [Planomonospora sp. ID67723]
MGAIIFNESGQILLVRRGHPPGEGLWSVPGGRIEPGESDAEAVAREVLEETGLTVSVGSLAGVVDRPGPGRVVYEIRDYLAEATGGTLAAGDDAADARWFDPGELPDLPLSPGLLDVLAGWALIDRPPGSSATG